MTIPAPSPVGQVLSMPAWIPGSYMIRDFAKNIVTIAAHCGGVPVKLEKLDKQTWRCEPCDAELVICYEVYAWDFSVRSAHLDTTHGYFNGTSVFLKAVGREHDNCKIEILPPSGHRYRDWRVATTLSTDGATHQGFGAYQAADYEEVIDHPVEMGNFSHAVFQVSGVEHEIVITGRHRADMQRLCTDLKAICETHASLYGGLPPMERYLFQVMAVGEGYGGLEHRSSTSLICKRSDLPVAGEEKVGAGYRRFLGLCSHEYFHLWNVKRIKPLVLQKADLSTEVYTRLLWAFEGITSYYDDLALVRSGRVDVEGYLQLLAETITRVVRCSGRLKQTLSDSSFDAWTKFYKQDENSPNAIISYYAKGALVALLLDLTIRQRTEGEKSLDDLMFALWEGHGRSGIGVEESGIEHLAQQVTGLDLHDFFDATLRSTAELDLERALTSVGVGYRLRPSRGPQDQGGLRQDDDKQTGPSAVLGIRHEMQGNDLRVTHVFDGGAAQQAGLSAGDIILAVDGIRVPVDGTDKLLYGLPPDARVSIHVFRRDELLEFELQPRPPAADTCELWLHGAADQIQLRARAGWLKLEN
jgi:predicted metalloprotease with PDZ domain